MTAIAGLKHRGDVWLGADSAGSAGHYLSVHQEPKVYRRGEIGIAFTSSFRFGQLLQHTLVVPPILKSDLHAWMVVDFVGAVRTCLRAGGWLKKKEEQESAGTCLVAVRGRLFQMQDDLQISERAGDFDVSGCGHDLLLGALASQPKSMAPRTRVRSALGIAARYSAWVAPPFRILCIKGPK